MGLCVNAEARAAPASETTSPAESAHGKAIVRAAPGVVEGDIVAGGAARGWAPQASPVVAVSPQTQATWFVDARLRLFNVVNLHRAYYESNALVAPTGSNTQLDQAAAAATKSAWLLGMLGVQVNPNVDVAVRYEARSFATTVTPDSPVLFIPRDAAADALATAASSTTPVRMTSTLQTLFAGVLLRQDSKPTDHQQLRIGGVFVGLGVTQIQKPYVYPSTPAMVFDARFQGIGMAIGIRSAPEPDHPFWDLTIQQGYGTAKLTDKVDLKSLLPNDMEQMWFLGLGGTAGYFVGLTKGPPTVSIGAVGNADFNYFFATKKDDKYCTTNSAGETVCPTYGLNYDLLWGAQARVLVSF
jgi:hypothetical protein